MFAARTHVLHTGTDMLGIYFCQAAPKLLGVGKPPRKAEG